MKNNFINSLLFLGGIMAILNINSYAAFSYTGTPEEKDSIIIKLGNSSKVMVYFTDKKDLEIIQSYDLNKILSDLSKNLDTVQKGEDQLFLKDRDGNLYMPSSNKDNDTFPFEKKFSGNYEDIEVDKFSALKAGGNLTVYVRKGDLYELKAKGESIDIEKVSAKVRNNILHLSLQPNTRNMGKVEVLVTTPNLHAVDFSGAVNSYVKGFREDYVKINASGASNVNIDVESGTMDVDINGASKMKLSGSGKMLNINASGASHLNAYNFEAMEVQAIASGAAKVNVLAIENLSASASGAGQVAYKGDPNVSQVKQSGAGKISSTRGSFEKQDIYPKSRPNDENPEKTKPVNKSYSGTRHSFNLELGLNNYLQNGEFPQAQDYVLNPLGSRYVALSSIWKTYAGNRVSFEWGGNISWYNFRFQDKSIRAISGLDQIQFEEITNINSAIRSKLTAAYLGGSFVPMFHFGKKNDSYKKWGMNLYSKSGFRIGLGGYAGYRIDSYSKFVFNDGGETKREREKDHFSLNNFRYGTRLQMGYRGLDLFANYDFNHLFQQGRGPELNAFSFGIIF